MSYEYPGEKACEIRRKPIQHVLALYTQTVRIKVILGNGNVGGLDFPNLKSFDRSKKMGATNKSCTRERKNVNK